MKSSRILNIFLMSSLALTAACADEEPQYEAVSTTLFARMDEDPVTKTFLSGPVSGVYHNLWSDNDEIGVFVGENTVSKFSLKNGAGTSKGEFQGEFKDPNGVSMEKTAVYPFAIVNGKSGSSVSVTLPEEQLYKADNIADGALPMVAVANGSELNFKNLCSVLKISMTGSLTVNSITFTANNSNVKVSGDASVDTGNTTLTMADNAGSRLVLKCDGVKLSDTTTEFFIVVPSQTYTGGFSLIIDTDNGKVLKSITSDVSIKRSELYRITPFECMIDGGNDNIIFEDENFKAYMVANFDTDNDGEISREEALSVTKIEVNTDNIKSLAGIEYMTNIQYLSCSGNRKWNRSTKKYDIYGMLKSLDISKNTKLAYLNVSCNPILSLDVSNNQSLITLSCYSNNLSSLDVSNNLELKYLDCSDNNLSSLDVNNNLELQELSCGRTNLSSLDVSNNQKLEYLNCYENNLSSLDVSNNPKLKNLDCTYNKLSSLNVSNCPKLHQLYCYINNLSTLDISNNPELTYLTCHTNNISSLDVSNNTKLKSLVCNNNNIPSLDVSNNPELTELLCHDNNLSILDVSNIHKLTYLMCDSNNLSALDISNNPELTYLSCGSNNLSSINVSNNTNLYYINIRNNNISSLNVNNNQELERIDCFSNKLSSLDVSNNPKLQKLYCFNNNISSLDISNNTALTLLHATGNPLATLFIYNGQNNSISDLQIPSTTRIVVKGSEEPDEPEEWASKEFWHKSLAMRFTATWCGYCPNLATGFAKAVSQYPNKIEQLNLHPASSNLGFSGTSALSNIFNVTGYPTGMIDYRSRIGNYASDYAATTVVDAVKETEKNYPVKTGISFSSSVSGSKLNLNVKLYIKEKGDYKVTAVLVEDNIIGYQNGGGNSYNHSGIARVAFTDITGDEVSTSEDNKTVSKNYTATIPSSCDKNNLRVLVYVLRQYGSQTIIRTADYGDYYVDNAISAAVGTTQDLVFSDGTVYGGNEDTKDGGEITLK